MDWFVLIFLVPLFLVPIVLLCGFAGCTGEDPAPYTPPPSPPATSPPATPAPSNLVAKASGTRVVKVTWKDNSGGTAKFSISRAVDGDKLAEIRNDVMGEIFDDKFADLPASTATEGTTFVYQVKATIPGNPSSNSVKTSTTTLPEPPVNLTATPEDTGKLELSWINASNKAKEFRLEHRSPPGVGVFSPIPSSSHGGLPAGSKHEYRVFAIVDGYDNDDPKKVESLPSDSLITEAPVWKTAYAMPLGAPHAGSWVGYCLVQRIDKAHLASGGTKVRGTLGGPAMGNLVIREVTISEAVPVGALKPWDSATTPTKLKLPSSSGVSLSAGSPSLTLAPVDYTLDPGKDLIIAFDIDSTVGNGNVRRVNVTGATFFSQGNAAEAYVPGGNRSAGYDKQDNWVYIVEKIEVLTTS